METIVDEMRLRGLLSHISDEEFFQDANQGEKKAVYCGFDPTSDSLHVGNLLLLVTLKRFSDFGFPIVALIGGATGLIGDPSGKSVERVLSSIDEVVNRTNALKRQISEILNISSNQIVNNIDWMREITVIDFLRDVGKHFSVNAMLQKDSVKNRIESNELGISFTEFSYMLLQSYDFLTLYQSRDCRIQIGGSDQWGNIANGITLIRRAISGSAYGMTVPLIEKSDGSKFGKSESGAIWLDAKYTSPYMFYQFWMNASDEDSKKWIYAFSFLAIAEINALVEKMQVSPENRYLQRQLADEMTLFVHGQESLNSAKRITDALFGKEGLDSLTLYDFQQLILDGLPSSEVRENDLLLDILVSTSLCRSKGIGRQLISGRGVEVNQSKVESAEDRVGDFSYYFDQYVLLKKGKKSYHLLIVTPEDS